MAGDVDRIGALARSLAGVQIRQTDAGVEYRRDETLFAVRSGSSLAFRLRSDIVGAGLRTPGTRPSMKGADWIELALTGADPDEFALDRAAAWFEAAWRIAAE